MTTRSSLGKNITALLGSLDLAKQTVNTGAHLNTEPAAIRSNTKANAQTETTLPTNTIHEIALTQLHPGPMQPRSIMDDETLQELAQSIKAQGILQPIVARERKEGGYEIIAGERRFRAAKIAQLKTVPVIIKSFDDETAALVALIENIQREDLNPMEQAIAIDKLIKNYQLTHQEVAEVLGKSRTAISNFVRLLSLPDSIKHQLMQGDLEMGHARALLSLREYDQVRLARQIIEKKLSVRDTENQVRILLQKKTAPAYESVNGDFNHKTESATVLPETILQLCQQLELKLTTAIKINHQTKGNGSLVIPYASLPLLKNVLEKMLNK